MRISVAEAAQAIESRGLLKRHRHDQYPRVIGYARSQLGRELPSDLADFYAERIESIGEFKAIYPVWNEWVGWGKADGEVTRLLHADAVPLFWDGCGNISGWTWLPATPLRQSTSSTTTTNSRTPSGLRAHHWEPFCFC